MPSAVPDNATATSVNALLRSLPANEQERIETEAMASAEPVLLEGHRRSREAGHTTTAESYRRMIVEQFLLKNPTRKCA